MAPLMATATQPRPSYRHPELLAALKDVRRYFLYAGLFSAAVNVLMLTPIIYMLTVYDRVVASGSISTLGMLTLLLVGLLMSLGGFEWVRSMILIGASNRIETRLRGRVSDAAFKSALMSGGMAASAQPVSDLTGLRQFLTGPGIFAFFDAPWFPIYISVMFMFHPWFGVAGIFAGMVMMSLALINEATTSKRLRDANTEAARVSNQLQGSLRNAEVVAAMGMAENVRRRQDKRADRVLALQTAASRKAGMLTSMSKSTRMIMQSLLLGMGAYLALNQQISPGMMIAGSLLLGRALAPIDLLVNTWKGFSVARAQYSRLGDLLRKVPPDAETMSLPAPEGRLEAEQVAVVPPGSRTMVVRGVTFSIEPGEILAIVGPSASGKSSLARALLGIWPAHVGKVRLDGADIAAWDRQELGPHLGYLPQDIELFDGTIADNICRFAEPDPEKIVAAAELCGVHEMILHLPKGYDTVIGGAGGMLSGGQRQRVGLARAVYGGPKLAVLDEPNSNLDDQGERDLVDALGRIRSRGCTLIVITHRTLVLRCVDRILAMKEGAMSSIGPKDQMLARLTGPTVVPRSAAG